MTRKQRINRNPQNCREKERIVEARKLVPALPPGELRRTRVAQKPGQLLPGNSLLDAGNPDPADELTG